MKCLVTGGAGFIGSNLALVLEAEGQDVTILDNSVYGKSANLEGFRGKMIQGDCCAPPALEGTFSVIFHLAAITDPRYEDNEETLDKNVEGFRQMLMLAQKTGSKLIYASSASVYGNNPVPQKEDQKKDILSAYARSKLMMDEMAQQCGKDMRVVGLRYFNVFGPHESHKGRPASMIFHLANQMKAGQRPKIFKYGEQKRDHIYVRDCVRATLLARSAPSGVYNVGTGISTSFNDLIRILNEVLGTSLQPEYIDNPYAGTYQEHTQADTSKAKKELGFVASYSLKDAIREYLNGVGAK